MTEPTQEQIKDYLRGIKRWFLMMITGFTVEKWKVCIRCGAIRTDKVASDICGSCADDLRMEQEAYSGQANSDTRAD